MNYDVVVTCAVTGAGDTTGKSPHVPVTPKEVADPVIPGLFQGHAREYEQSLRLLLRLRSRHRQPLLALPEHGSFCLWYLQHL